MTKAFYETPASVQILNDDVGVNPAFIMSLAEFETAVTALALTAHTALPAGVILRQYLHGAYHRIWTAVDQQSGGDLPYAVGDTYINAANSIKTSVLAARAAGAPEAQAEAFMAQPGIESACVVLAAGLTAAGHSISAATLRANWKADLVTRLTPP